MDSIYKDTTGTLLMKLKKSGVTDIEELSSAMDNLRKQQLAGEIYGFDNFTDRGSDAFAKMSSALHGEKKDCSVWSVNHYLGLNRHPDVIEASINAVREYGTGCGTSAISGGMNTLHKKIEEKLTQWTGKEGIMLFPTGFTANLGVIGAICQADDHVLIDGESHASIRDGVRISRARRWIEFEHNSLADIERKLKTASESGKGRIIVIVESAYSMSGDICPLQQLVKLKERYDFLLVVDEAHSFGLYSTHGQGLCHQLGVLDKVDFLTSTFSKATASIGGFVATRPKYISYFQWAINTFAFQACFSPADAATILAAMEVLEREPEIIRDLHNKNGYMRARLRAAGFDLGTSQSPIIPVYIPDTEKLLKTCFDAYKLGVFSVPIAHPMVRAHEGRIRFIVNARHTLEHIDHTVAILAELAVKYDLLPDQQVQPEMANIA
jgi:glycine C-acetyltransferase